VGAEILGMDGRRIDTAARMLAGGYSRRRVLGLLVRGAVGGGLGLVGPAAAAAARKDKDKEKDKDKDNGPACRGEGHPCEGNQVCCAGLTCTASGPGAARRCTADGAAEFAVQVLGTAAVPGARAGAGAAARMGFSRAGAALGRLVPPPANPLEVIDDLPLPDLSSGSRRGR